MSPLEAGDGLESIVEFQAQIKGHNQREYEDRWQGWQNWTDEKLATKLTKDDQQPVLLLPARWWPDTLPEFESGGWWQRPYTRVKCRQCKCGFVENPSFRSSKCSFRSSKCGCGKQMKTKGKRPEVMMIAFITIKSSLVPLIEGLCAQIYFRFEISVVCSHLLLFFFVKEKTC